MANGINLSDPDTPVRAVSITIDADRREHFFMQLRNFSTKHSFSHRISHTTPSGKDFIIEMLREDLRILGTNSFNPYKFRFFVYKIDNQYVSPKYIDNLIADFENIIREIPGAKFSGEPYNENK